MFVGQVPVAVHRGNFYDFGPLRPLAPYGPVPFPVRDFRDPGGDK